MDNTYCISVEVNNRYTLFEDDEIDPFEVLSLREQEKELEKKAKIAKKENKIKTDASTSKGKPDIVQKRTKKENTIQKVQENKQDNFKQNHQRLHADDKMKRERNNSDQLRYENREKLSNQRHHENRSFNGSENRKGQDRPRGENNGGNFENRNRDERGGNHYVTNNSIGPCGPKRPYEQPSHRGKSEFDTKSRSRKTEADKTNGNDKPRRDNNGGNFENRNRDRGERDNNRFLGNNSTGPRGPRRPFEERDRWGKRELDTQTSSSKTEADKNNGNDKPRKDSNGGNFENRYRDRGERDNNRFSGNNLTGPRDRFDRWGKRDFDTQTGSGKTEADQSRGNIEKLDPNVLPQQKEAAAAKVIAEEEPKELTLDEWKAQLAGRAKPQYNIRKAGEAEEEPSHWKEMYELRKQKNEPEIVEAAECPQRVRRQKQVLDIGTLFDCTRRDAGPRGREPRDDRPNQRGGPGGPRGNSRYNGAGGERPGRRYRDEQDGEDERSENHRVPKVDDERDFPSLRRGQ